MIRDAWEQFMSEFVNLQGRSPNSVLHYTTAMNSLSSVVTEFPITTSHLAVWVGSLKERGIAPSTINVYLDYIGSFCKWACRKKLMEENPFEGFKRKRPEIQPPRAIKWTEAKVAVENCYGKFMSRRDAAFLDTLLHTGARCSEATGLTLDNLDMEEYKITLENTKGREPRIVYIGPKYGERLSQYLDWRLAHWPNSPYVFPARYGGHMDSKAAQEIPRRYGIPYKLHQFRHTFATETLKKTGNLRTVQILLGHKSITTTARYLQVWDEDKRAAADALENIDEVQRVNKRGKRIG